MVQTTTFDIPDNGDNETLSLIGTSVLLLNDTEALSELICETLTVALAVYATAKAVGISNEEHNMTKNQQSQQTSYLGPEAVASISFLKTRELMFTWQQDDKIQSKLITNEAAFLAFKDGHQQDTGWLPAGVLRVGSNARGEWVVCTERAQLIDIVTDKSEKLRIPIPATLFMGWGSRYYLWALPNKKFNKKLPVFKAPFPNIYDNGRICWGSHKVPKVSVNNIERVWQMFFGTAFNEHIASKKCKSFPDNVLDLLRKLSREEATTFPYKELGKADMGSVDLCIDRLLKYGAD